MTVEFGVDDEGTLILKVVSSKFRSQQEFVDAGGLMLALKVGDQAVSASTDIRVIQAFDNLKKGGDVLIDLKRKTGGPSLPRVQPHR